jgi:hypothetical protein
LEDELEITSIDERVATAAQLDGGLLDRYDRLLIDFRLAIDDSGLGDDQLERRRPSTSRST